MQGRDQGIVSIQLEFGRIADLAEIARHRLPIEVLVVDIQYHRKRGAFLAVCHRRPVDGNQGRPLHTPANDHHANVIAAIATVGQHDFFPAATGAPTAGGGGGGQ
ncbi:MAG: hypothetical protein R3F40_10060 [Candidatus Competibacteraceae bacterium]